MAAYNKKTSLGWRDELRKKLEEELLRPTVSTDEREIKKELTQRTAKILQQEGLGSRVEEFSSEVIEKTDMSKMRSNREEIEEAGQEYGANEHDRYTSTSTADVKRDPVRNLEPKIGRNDPCPCGSGKKFKQCHGK